MKKSWAYLVLFPCLAFSMNYGEDVAVCDHCGAVLELEEEWEGETAYNEHDEVAENDADPRSRYKPAAPAKRSPKLSREHRASRRPKVVQRQLATPPSFTPPMEEEEQELEESNKRKEVSAVIIGPSRKSYVAHKPAPQKKSVGAKKQAAQSRQKKQVAASQQRKARGRAAQRKVQESQAVADRGPASERKYLRGQKKAVKEESTTYFYTGE